MFNAGMHCVKASDLPCAELALNKIPSQSPYAKLLAGSIALANDDSDGALRLLLPLQAETSLTDAAFVSLHASLALAYDKLGDPLRALEQRTRVDRYAARAADAERMRDNQQAIWSALSALSNDQLIDMRGESTSTSMQGWIDLALASRSNDTDALANWRQFYPDHLASNEFLKSLGPSSAGTQPATAVTATDFNGPIALILPFAVESFYPAADAIERGFMAAHAQHQNKSEVKIYATRGAEHEILDIYQNALSEGVRFVVGPLTRDEVMALSVANTLVPTLALNQPEALKIVKPGLYSFGLSVIAEARQIARTARELGMQTASVIASDNPLGAHMASAFSEAWVDEGGQIKLQAAIARLSDLENLDQQLGAQPADMIFMAADVEEARKIRPFMNIATPTFAISHVFSGAIHEPLDKPLLAMRFVDMPWLLNPDEPAFAAYRQAADDLPPGKMQRWFAIGVDAYHLLEAIAQKPNQDIILRGLSGKLHVSANGQITRQLSLGSFAENGVVLEKSP